MAKDASLFSSFDTTTAKNIYVEDDFALDTIGHGDVSCRHGQIIDMFHVPSLSANLLSISQLAQTSKIVEFWPNCFFIKDIKKDRSIIVEGVLYPKDQLYKFHNLP